eukprot:5231115-Amphidinium_carterae.2
MVSVSFSELSAITCIHAPTHEQPNDVGKPEARAKQNRVSGDVAKACTSAHHTNGMREQKGCCIKLFRPAPPKN